MNSIAEQYNITAKFGTFFMSHRTMFGQHPCKRVCECYPVHTTDKQELSHDSTLADQLADLQIHNYS